MGGTGGSSFVLTALSGLHSLVPAALRACTLNLCSTAGCRPFTRHCVSAPHQTSLKGLSNSFASTLHLKSQWDGVKPLHSRMPDHCIPT